MRPSLRSLAFTLILSVMFAVPAFAGSPSGLDWFQLLTNQQTGADNTGDGGTGNGDDLNYYYVGQTFTSVIQIKSTGPGATAGNIWIDYPSTTTTASNLTTGTFFNSWSGQVVSSTVSAGVGRVFSTGFNVPVTQSSGTGTFGTVDWTVTRPTELSLATSSPATLDINIGTIGNTTESNISLAGADLLDSAEDFQVHFWADTIKPFAETGNVASGTSGITIDTNYLFRLFDTRRGEGFSTSTAYNAGGVGTGVNTAAPPGSLVLTPNHFTPTSYDAYSCSGTWGTNVCDVTLDPPSPLAIGGDTRNWEYNQLYQLCISSYQDFASATQSQLGELNGPNAMNAKCFSFTTEADTVAPQVVSESPIAASTGNAVNTNITINVEDRKTYPSGPSGTGVATSTCNFNVWSPSQATTTYSAASPTVTTSATSYGKQYVINPAVDFAQNERVFVQASDCADLASNAMTVDTWYFNTSDSDAPFVINRSPDNDQVAATSTNIQFQIRDDGSGVDINNTVVYINGVYYTETGGAGTVTNSGTIIAFASSTDFTSFWTSTSTAQYNFSIGPIAFSEGESIPIIVYSRDLSGNLMPYYVYGLTANGSGICPSGSTFCGSNTTWNGSTCVGSASSSSSSSSSSNVCSGGGSPIPVSPQVNNNVMATQIDGDSVLLSWTSNYPGTSRVAFGDRSSSDLRAPNQGYSQTTSEDTVLKTYHSIIIDGLDAGTLYFFRPVTMVNGETIFGQEVLMVPVFATRVISEAGIPIPVATICPKPPTSVPSPTTRPSRTGPVPTQPAATPSTPFIPSIPTSPAASGSGLRITEIRPRSSGGGWVIGGEGGSGRIRVDIY
jgi:hypothetical protein